MNYRLIVLLSPYIEKSVYEGNEHVVGWFISTLKLFRRMKNIANLIIPSNLYYSCNTKIKIILEPYKGDSQSGLIVLENISVPCETTNGLFDFDFYSDFVRLFVFFMNSRDVPLVIDETAYELKKIKCADCLPERFCNPEITVNTALLKQEDHGYDEIISNFYEDYLCYLNRNKLIDTDKDINVLSVFTAMLHGVPQDELVKFRGVKYHDSLLNEIKDLNRQDLKDVVSSIFRAIVFPPTGDNSARHKNSIDWHVQPGFKKIYRCDVVPWHKSGIGASGKKRLLFKKVDNETHFLAYTNSHDFSNSLIEKRGKI